MNGLLSSMVYSLSSHPQACDIEIKIQPPVSYDDLSSWEYKHHVFLPQDLKEYFMSQNGMLLTWSIKAGNNTYRVGRVAICELDKMVLIKLDHESQLKHQFKLPSKIFRLDENPSVGSICLLYRPSSSVTYNVELSCEKPFIGILGNGGMMEYMTDNFTKYFRLMIAYAGIEEWPNRVRGLPLSPVTKQWYYIMGKFKLVED
eukprot:TRINITY_DN3785_c0_g1_i5.p1 TRINITY_DN3785_c0_g1~~TRINITY_DN3785_c0_g1_i5.p1  ORF type:complete len:202 (+),score=10.03 TRINITY_DN3785_c0_g1_i5:29-634(+)